MSKAVCLVGFTFLLVASPASAAPPTNPDATTVDAVIRDAMKAWGVPGAAVVIVRDDKVVYLQGHGVRSSTSDKAVTPDTVFPLASCTKAFTTALMAMLVDDGKLKWDDPVRKHLDWFRLGDALADRDVTLRDLVTHRTGLRPHDFLWYRAPWSLEESVRRAGRLPLDKPFRGDFQYQSTMFVAAGLAAGSAGKSTWADLVQTRLLDPLEMKNASLTTTAAEKTSDRASGHRRGADGKPEVVSWYPQETPDPAGSLNASARDLGNWLRFQLAEGSYNSKRLVSAESLRETHTPQFALRVEGTHREMNPETNLMSYGMGWLIQDYRGRKLVSHAGAIDGFRATVMMVPDDRLGVAILCNLEQTRMTLALGNTLLDMYLGAPKKDWNAHYLTLLKKDQAAARSQLEARLKDRQPGTKPSHDLTAYAGTYEHPAYGTARVGVEDGKLVLRWSSFTGPLEHFHYDTFLIGNEHLASATVTFATGADGKVKSMEVTEPLGVTFTRK
jgi:CubicO group peptidase (beta-lactamase class C family)